MDVILQLIPLFGGTISVVNVFFFHVSPKSGKRFIKGA